MPYEYESRLYVLRRTIWLFSKGSRNNEICNIFWFLGYDWIIQSYWQYKDNVSLYVFAKMCVIVNLVVVTKFCKCFHRFVKWNMSLPVCFKGLFYQYKMYLPGCRWVLWYFIKDCLPRVGQYSTFKGLINLEIF